MNLVLRDVTLPDGARCALFVTDARLADEPSPGARVIDAGGLIALPGLVDPHAHLREPGGAGETIASGTAAAARGGYTAIAAMPNTTPACNGPSEVRALMRLARESRAGARVVPVGAVTQDRGGRRLADLAGLGRAGVRLFSDDGAAVATADLLRHALVTIAPLGGTVSDHCQDPRLAGPNAWWPDSLTPDGRAADEVWPAEAEVSIVKRDVQVAAETGCHVHLAHLSCAESVEVVRWAKSHRVNVTAEVTPHHLYFTSDRLAGGDTTFKVNPPLRTTADRDALRDGLVDGTIDMIGTDHAPHPAAAKDRPWAQASPGLTALEQALGVVVQTLVAPGRIGWPDVARLMSTNPARLLRLHNQGRHLTPGSPASLTLIDPGRRAAVAAGDTASLAANNPYVGLELPNPVVLTLWAGRPTYSAL